MKKKWWIPVAVLVILLALAGGAAWYLTANTLGFSTGRCIEASNGSYLILMDHFPVQMSNRTGNEALFADLKTGDKILLLHDGITETYPGGTGAYFCKRLEEGSIADISDDVIESLSSLGWLVTDDAGKTREIYTGTVISYDPVDQDPGNYLLKIKTGDIDEITLTVAASTDVRTWDGLSTGDRVRLKCMKEESTNYRQVLELTELLTVSYAHGNANMGLELPAGWDYAICEYQEDGYTFGIDFWPADQTVGKLKLQFYVDGFGVCGTGLEEEQIQLNGLRAYQGTYDGRAVWDFISFRGLPGSYVVTTENADAWWDTYGGQAMEILQTLSLAQGILWEQEAASIAEGECTIAYDTVSAQFDFCEGIWTVRFSNKDSEKTQTVEISADGRVMDVFYFDRKEVLAAKPVIYLYPELEQQVTVKLDFAGTLTTTYPAYQDGWTVMAQPDGTLTDPDTEREYYCLFWEGVTDAAYDFSAGFVVPGGETAAFLEDALAKLGLTEKEANEFILYWLPQMEGNAYNLIAFQQEAYTDSAQLRITPEPDTLIRVFMAWKALDAPVELPAQELEGTARTGFTVIEWGGAEVK